MKQTLPPPPFQRRGETEHYFIETKIQECNTCHSPLRLRQRRGETSLIILGLLILTGSCASVKGFEKKYLSSEEMQLREKTLEQFEISIETYREGASGANGGQTGGGCGCN